VPDRDVPVQGASRRFVEHLGDETHVLTTVIVSPSLAAIPADSWLGAGARTAEVGELRDGLPRRVDAEDTARVAQAGTA